MLAVGRFEVTFAEWGVCAAGAPPPADDSVGDEGANPHQRQLDGCTGVRRLAGAQTGKHYRLLTEAEWEMPRGRARKRYWWGNQAGRGDANCYDCGSRWDGRQPAPVGRFFPNPFGLYDMHGNVSEWVEDCYHYRYQDAPSDGSAWTFDCTATTDTRMVRGGAWRGSTDTTRSAARSAASFTYYDSRIGCYCAHGVAHGSRLSQAKP
jgi:formylglycine-generating enzyme required for sulfatase activity